MSAHLLCCGWVRGVFFFKRKTAYDLRISDWSSDVCSSDLFVLHLSYAWLPAGLILLGCATLHPLLPVSSAVHALGAGAMGAMTLEIGRASCRDRGWKYV